PPFLRGIELQRMEEAFQVLGAFDPRLAMLRAWTRHHPPPGDPAVPPTENDSVGQLATWRRGRISHRLVSIRTPKRLEPARRMKDRGPGVSLDKLRPAWIL